MWDENQPWGAAGGGEEGVSGPAASEDASPTPRGSLAAPHPALSPGPGCSRLSRSSPCRCDALMFTCVLQANASLILMCTHLAHPLPPPCTLTSHILTRTPCTPVPSLLPGVVSGLSSTAPGGKPGGALSSATLCFGTSGDSAVGQREIIHFF